MKVSKVIRFGNVPMGTQLWLTDAQASARQHAISPADSDKRGPKDRKRYTANQQLGFKAGEELAIEGNLDRGLEQMFGIEPDAHAGRVKPAKKHSSAVAEDENPEAEEPEAEEPASE